MSRLLSLAVLAALVFAAPIVAAPARPDRDGARSSEPAKRKPRPSWAKAEIRLVVARGLMARSVASFRPNDPLTQGELSRLIAGLTRRSPAPTAAPEAPVTLATLDARLVRALGLRAAALRFALVARRAGLDPPARFGTEVVARLLGLRKNHPAGSDELELSPTDPATRAEAAYSAARILGFQGFEVAKVKESARSFELPAASRWQKSVLRTAAGLIGYPYVWGGTSERSQAPFGAKAPGGFDCSGFVWRVYKLESYEGAPTLGTTLRGRTTFALSAEFAAKRRIPLARLAPADLLFFGARGRRSKPREVDHMGIYLGGGWFIHSSRYGVALAELADWYRERFAWGRRPLAEARLGDAP